MYIFSKKYYYNLNIHYKLLIASIVLLGVLLLKGISLPLFNSEVYALLFSIIIYNLVTYPYRISLLENKVMRFLGDISYGIYMYNPMGVLFSYYITTQVLHLAGWNLSITYTAMAIAITIALASISYYGIERYFLRWKPV